jgi:hypothetical protein
MNVARSTWTAGAGDQMRRLEEHYLARKTPQDWWSGHVFLKQAYSYWRYGVCSERAMKDAAPLLVDSYRYDDREALLAALREGLIAQGSIVWTAVSDEAVDTDVQFESLAEKVPVERLQHGVAGDTAAARELDGACAYQWTPDLLRRSELLRSLLAYDKPLVLVIAGDSGCRLDPPKTHHTIVFANDAAPPDSQKSLWFPEGLEGLESLQDFPFWQPQAADNAKTLSEADDSLDADERPYLLDLVFSVNGRKPSRGRLVSWLLSGGVDELAAVSDKALRIRAVVADADDELQELLKKSPDAHEEDSAWRVEISRGNATSVNGDAASLFSLAPAGDTWSSGRVLEGMLRGAVPVVDGTYATDGGLSAKGCSDPAAAWRDAPFVFVSDWAELPSKLEEFLKRDTDYMGAVRSYRKTLEDHLRENLIDASLQQKNASSTTSCHTEEWTPGEMDTLVDAAASYYAGDWWATSDSPGFYAAGCGHAYRTNFDLQGKSIIPIQRKMHCYDADCAFPLVKSFNCRDRAPAAWRPSVRGGLPP